MSKNTKTNENNTHQRDHRYLEAKKEILAGRIIHFRDMFPILPAEVIARDLGIEVHKFIDLAHNVSEFELGIIFSIADLIGIDETTIMKLALAQNARDLSAI